MKKLCLVGVCVFILGLLIGGVMPAIASSSKDVAAFYKGKVVNLVVPFKAGGGIDNFARLVAPHLGRYLDATVVVKNVPGGGGKYGLNQIYKAKPDGLTIATADTGSLILSQLFKEPGVQYDYKNFIWLARLSWGKRAILVGKNSPYKTFQDLMAAKMIKAPSTSKTDGAAMTWALLAHYLDIPPERITMVPGYGGGKQIMMSTMQGETDSASLTEDTAFKFSKGGMVRVLLTVDKERSDFFPEIPTNYEFMKAPKEREWPLATYLSLQKLRRCLVTSPGVSADKVAFLRGILNKCLADKDLLADAKKQKRPIIPLSGQEMEKEITEKIGKLSEKQLKEFAHIALEKYHK